MLYKFVETHGDSRVIIEEEAKDNFSMKIQRRRDLIPAEICFEVKRDKPAALMRGNYSELIMLAKGFLQLQLHELDSKLRVEPDIALVEKVFDKQPNTETNRRYKRMLIEFYSDPLESERAFCRRYRNEIKYTTFRSKKNSTQSACERTAYQENQQDEANTRKP